MATETGILIMTHDIATIKATLLSTDPQELYANIHDLKSCLDNRAGGYLFLIPQEVSESLELLADALKKAGIAPQRSEHFSRNILSLESHVKDACDMLNGKSDLSGDEWLYKVHEHLVQVLNFSSERAETATPVRRIRDMAKPRP